MPGLGNTAVSTFFYRVLLPCGVIWCYMWCPSGARFKRNMKRRNKARAEINPGSWLWLTGLVAESAGWWNARDLSLSCAVELTAGLSPCRCTRASAELLRSGSECLICENQTKYRALKARNAQFWQKAAFSLNGSGQFCGRRPYRSAGAHRWPTPVTSDRAQSEPCPKIKEPGLMHACNLLSGWTRRQSSDNDHRCSSECSASSGAGWWAGGFRVPVFPPCLPVTCFYFTWKQNYAVEGVLQWREVWNKTSTQLKLELPHVNYILLKYSLLRPS